MTGIAHLSLRTPMFGERRFGVLFGVLELNLIVEALFWRARYQLLL